MGVEAVSSNILQVRALTPAELEAGRTGSDFQTLLNAQKAENASGRVYRGLTVSRVSSGPAGEISWTGTPGAEITAQAAPYMDIIREASRTFGVPANIIMAIIKCESDYVPHVTSSSGAMGLMQIMPFNAEDYGMTDGYDPKQNIFCGAWLLRKLLDMYGGDMKLALLGYNIGCGTIRRLGVTSSDSEAYRTNIPIKAQQYTDKVLRLAGAAV